MKKDNRFKLGNIERVNRKTIDIIVDDCRYFVITRDYNVNVGPGCNYIDLIDFEPTCDELFSEKEKSYIMGLYCSGWFEKWLVD